MRFLFIIDTLDTGGAERMVLSLGEKLLELGHDVDLLVIKDIINLSITKGMKLHVLGYKKIMFFPYNLIYALSLRRYVARIAAEGAAFDLIVSNLNLSNRLTHIAKMKNVYYCIHEAVSISSLSRRKGLKRFFRGLRFKRMLKGKDIITVSVGIKNDLLKVVKTKPRTIRAIYNGVNFSRIIAMAKLGDNDDRGDYVVHVGRLNRQKRHDRLLEAFKKSGIDCKLVLVGEGLEKAAIEMEIDRLGLAGQVEMVGNLSNPYPVIKDALMMLLSSDYEGMPTVLLESFVLSTPVVSVDCCYGPREILGDKYNKYLARDGDADDLAEKIKIAMDDIKRNELVVSPEYVEKFNIDNVAREYISLGKWIG